MNKIIVIFEITKVILIAIIWGAPFLAAILTGRTALCVWCILSFILMIVLFIHHTEVLKIISGKNEEGKEG